MLLSKGSTTVARIEIAYSRAVFEFEIDADIILDQPPRSLSAWTVQCGPMLGGQM